MRLLDAVPVGRAAARTARELQMLTAAKSPREITREVERLRRRGYPICATCGQSPGYYFAESPIELEVYLAALDRRLASVRRTRSSMGDTLAALTGQAAWSFFEDGEGFD